MEETEEMESDLATGNEGVGNSTYIIIKPIADTESQSANALYADAPLYPVRSTARWEDGLNVPAWKRLVDTEPAKLEMDEEMEPIPGLDGCTSETPWGEDVEKPPEPIQGLAGCRAEALRGEDMEKPEPIQGLAGCRVEALRGEDMEKPEPIQSLAGCRAEASRILFSSNKASLGEPKNTETNQKAGEAEQMTDGEVKFQTSCDGTPSETKASVSNFQLPPEPTWLVQCFFGCSSSVSEVENTRRSEGPETWPSSVASSTAKPSAAPLSLGSSLFVSEEENTQPNKEVKTSLLFRSSTHKLKLFPEVSQLLVESEVSEDATTPCSIVPDASAPVLASAEAPEPRGALYSSTTENVAHMGFLPRALRMKSAQGNANRSNSNQKGSNVKTAQGNAKNPDQNTPRQIPPLLSVLSPSRQGNAKNPDQKGPRQIPSLFCPLSPPQQENARNSNQKGPSVKTVQMKTNNPNQNGPRQEPSLFCPLSPPQQGNTKSPNQKGPSVKTEQGNANNPDQKGPRQIRSLFSPLSPPGCNLLAGRRGSSPTTLASACRAGTRGHFPAPRPAPVWNPSRKPWFRDRHCGSRSLLLPETMAQYGPAPWLQRKPTNQGQGIPQPMDIQIPGTTFPDIQIPGMGNFHDGKNYMG